MKILVAGATGFLGGSLVKELVQHGHQVRALVRHPEDRHRLIDPTVEIAVGDVLEPGSLYQALQDVSAVYYLVHAMGPQPRTGELLEQLERRGIENLIRACGQRGVSRVIYQGGLAESADAVSAHLRARWQVEAALEQADLDFTVLRAGLIIGRGSVGFEVLYRVVRDLPVIPLFRWSRQLVDPVALPDLLEILISSLEEPRTFRRAFDVSGCERLSYEELCRNMAGILGRSPRFVGIPVAGTRLTALGIQAATRIPFRLAIHLAPSLQVTLVCRERTLAEIFPGPRHTFRKAVEAAMAEPPRLAEPLWRIDELRRLAWALPRQLSAPAATMMRLPETLEQVIEDARLLWDPE